MKKALWIIPVVFLIAVNCFGNNRSGYYASQNIPAEDSSFVYNYLAPYGNWTEMSPYGYVWIPRHMGYRWRPYTDGRWDWTDYGWTWISDLEWGDIPFHYGRWGWDDGFGWFWVPGDVWGPAWVSWRSNDFYMGWAPLPPGIDFAFGMDFDSLFYDIPINFWVFVDCPHFQDRRMRRYVLPFERNQTIANQTSLHNNIRLHGNRAINEGIDVNEVQRITHRQINKYQIRDSQQPGPTKIKGKEIQLFRPEIRRFEDAKPKEFLNREEARQKLSPAKIWEPSEKQSFDKEQSDARQRQKDERKLLDKSQAQEIKDMNRRRAEEEKKNNDSAQKERIRRDYEDRMSEMKRRHDNERQDIQTRHSNDSNHIQSQNNERKKRG